MSTSHDGVMDTSYVFIHITKHVVCCMSSQIEADPDTKECFDGALSLGSLVEIVNPRHNAP